MSRADDDHELARLLTEGDERALTELARRFRGPAHAALNPLPEDERENALRAALVLAWNQRGQLDPQALPSWFYALLAQASGSRELAARLPTDAEGWEAFERGLEDDELPDDAAARRTVAAVLRDPALIRSAPEPSIEVAMPGASPAPRAAPQLRGQLVLVLILVASLANLALTLLRPSVTGPAPLVPDRLTGTDLRVICDADSDRLELLLWLDDQQARPRYRRSGPFVADTITIKRSELDGPRHRLHYRVAHRRSADLPEKVGAPPWRILIVLEQKIPGAREDDELEAWLALNKIELNAAIASPSRRDKRGDELVDVYEGELVLAGD